MVGEQNLAVLVGELKGQVAHLTDAVREGTRRSDEGRRALYGRIDGIEQQIGQMALHVQTIETRVAAVEPGAGFATRFRDGLCGVRLFLGFVILVCGGAIGAFWDRLINNLGSTP